MAILSKVLAKVAAPLAGAAAKSATPRYASGLIRSALDKAIDGIGPLPGAIRSAEKEYVENGGNREKAIKSLISGHVKLAGAQGFVTNLGGLMTAFAAIPANIAGLALVLCHMIAGIAHLRGYDLSENRVRNAVLACLVGEEGLKALIKDGKLLDGPRGLASAPYEDPETDAMIARIVATELIAQVGGKRLVSMAGRRIPLLGGAFGATADGFRAWQIGRFAANALPPRHIPPTPVR